MKTTGYIKGNYGEVIEVVLHNGKWVIKTLLEEGLFSTNHQHAKYTKYETDIDGSRVFDTPFEAISGKRKNIKKFSNKKAVFSTFIEQTSAKEKEE